MSTSRSILSSLMYKTPRHLFPARANFHLSRIKLGSEPSQRELVIGWRIQQDHIFWKKHRRDPRATISEPIPAIEILAIKVLNRIGDKGQLRVALCQSPNLTGRESELVPAMWTKLWEPTVQIRGPASPYSWRTSHRTPWGRRSNASSKSTKHMYIGWANNYAYFRTLLKV